MTFEPVRRQAPFEGSFRQRRAWTLRTVAAGPIPAANLDDRAVHALVVDGLVEVDCGVVRLPA
jgi:hypothetical protein